MGKSFLAQRLLQNLSNSKAPLIQIKCKQSDLDSSLDLLIAAIDNWYFENKSLFVDENVRHAIASLLKDGGNLFTYMPNLIGELGENEAASEALFEINDALVIHLVSSMLRLMFTDRNQLIVMLDDVQWADSTVIESVFGGLNELGSTRFTGIIISRPSIGLSERITGLFDKSKDSIFKLTLSYLENEVTANWCRSVAEEFNSTSSAIQHYLPSKVSVRRTPPKRVVLL